MRALAVFFLVAAVFAGCVNIEPPTPQVIMYCGECGQFTPWVEYCEEYIQCTVSGTRW